MMRHGWSYLHLNVGGEPFRSSKIQEPGVDVNFPQDNNADREVIPSIERLGSKHRTPRCFTLHSVNHTHTFTHW